MAPSSSSFHIHLIETNMKFRRIPTIAASRFLPAVLIAWAPLAHAGYFAQAEASAYLCEDPQVCSPILSDWPTTRTDGSYFYHSPWTPPITQASVSNGGSFETFDLYSTASADMASGSLRAAARIDNSAAAPGRTALVSASAWIGDSFSFSSEQGGSFDWDASGMATFNIHLEGVLINTSADPWPATYGIQFTVREHGAIQSTNGTPLTPRGGLNWSQWSTADGPGGYDFFSTGGALPITGTATGDLASGGLDLQFQFQPGRDFDWDLVLYTSASLTDLPGTKEADFGHTLQASFVAPAGAVVSSSSGVFPVTSPVPEPGTWALMLVGGAAVLRRACQRQCAP